MSQAMIQRVFAKSPPQEPLTTLAAIVRDWQRRTAPGGDLARSRDRVVEFCRQAPNLQEAIVRAVRSRDENGVMHNHQSRVQEAVRREFGERIWKAHCAFSPGLRELDFDSLYDVLEEQQIPGIGRVTTYDVATRIGAYLGIEPRSLYLHAGVWQGWKALRKTREGMTGLQAGKMPKRIARSAWPAELRHLPADQVEDFFCTYRSILHLVECPK